MDDLENIETWTGFGTASFLEKVWRSGLVEDQKLVDLLTTECEVVDGTATLSESPPSSGALGALSRELAEEHRALPLAVDPAKITIGMLDPLNTQAVSKIRAYGFLPIEVHAVKASVLFESLTTLYGIAAVSPEDAAIFRADGAPTPQEGEPAEPAEPAKAEPAPLAEEFSKDEGPRASIALAGAASENDANEKPSGFAAPPNTDVTDEVAVHHEGFDDGVDVSLGSLSGESQQEDAPAKAKEEWQVNEPARVQEEEMELAAPQENLADEVAEPAPDGHESEAASGQDPQENAQAAAMADAAFPDEDTTLGADEEHAAEEHEPAEGPPVLSAASEEDASDDLDGPDVVDESTRPQISAWGDAISDENTESVLLPVEAQDAAAGDENSSEKSEELSGANRVSSSADAAPVEDEPVASNGAADAAPVADIHASAERGVLTPIGSEFRSALLFAVEGKWATLSTSSVQLSQQEVRLDLERKGAFQRAFEMGNVAAGTRLAPSDVEIEVFNAIHPEPPSTFAVFPVGATSQPSALLYVDTAEGMLTDAQVSTARRFAAELN
ncbi:MAG: hypothetical protein GY822_07620 [Deltaproteobacteria bacterium]|nr:hypothetical protein [Deltaproteobacteria bacterium]